MTAALATTGGSEVRRLGTAGENDERSETLSGCTNDPGALELSTCAGRHYVPSSKKYSQDLRSSPYQILGGYHSICFPVVYVSTTPNNLQLALTEISSSKTFL